MTDIKLAMQEFGGDVVIVGADVAPDDGLQTAVIISLFCDAMCSPDDLPASETDLRGWWGDVDIVDDGDQTGSLLWLLRREKQLPSVLSRAQKYCEDALQWMIDDKIATSVAAAAEFTTQGWMGIAISITKPNGDRLTFRYDYAWQAQASA